MNRRFCDAERSCILDRLNEGNGVTLDGRPAVVTGRALDFPRVASLDGALSVEFSWFTLRVAVNKGRREFKS